MRRLCVLVVIVLSTALGWSQAPDTPAGAPQGAPSQGSSRHARGGAGWPGFGGTITAISETSMTVKTLDGQTAQVNLSDKTQFRKERQPAKLSDFKVGDDIVVRGEQKDGVWQAEVVAARRAGQMAAMREGLGKQFIVGEVKAINGTQLSIERPDNVTQTITADENTSFHKNNESITLADIKVGDHVFGRGQLKNDVFVPTVLNVGELHFTMGPHGGAATTEQK
jgi:hypothetical protein